MTATQPQALTLLGSGLSYAKRIRLQLFSRICIGPDNSQSKRPMEHMLSRVAWPSGLRRWIKAPVSSGAWVRIPLLPGETFWKTLLDDMAKQRAFLGRVRQVSHKKFHTRLCLYFCSVKGQKTAHVLKVRIPPREALRVLEMSLKILLEYVFPASSQAC